MKFNTMFKQYFPMFLVPIVLLGAGCSQPPLLEVQPVVEEEAMIDSGVQPEAMMETLFEDGNYIVVPASETQTATSVAWNAQKRVGASHNGTVEINEAALLVEKGEIVEGTIVVDMNTIVNLDLTDEKPNTMLVNHLKSEDFFSVETYPTATFAISSVTKIEGGMYDVTGDMTIKGIENEITFTATIEQDESGLQVNGTAVLDRTLWDVRYGSDKFFDNLGDGLIEDAFTLTFDMLFVVAQ